MLGGVQWRVPRGMVALKVAGTGLFVLVALLFMSEPDRAGLALVAAVVLGALALRDIVAPVRLAADGDGLVVITGFARRRRIPWAEIERVRVDVRQRLGLRSEMLEIDTGASLHLLSTYELGARCDEVADAIRSLRTGH